MGRCTGATLSAVKWGGASGGYPIHSAWRLGIITQIHISDVTEYDGRFGPPFDKQVSAVIRPPFEHHPASDQSVSMVGSCLMCIPPAPRSRARQFFAIFSPRLSGTCLEISRAPDATRFIYCRVASGGGAHARDLKSQDRCMWIDVSRPRSSVSASADHGTDLALI